MNVLFVDLLNVCRSPLAEALLKKKFLDRGIKGFVDSAGFESFNINEPPDTRVVNTGAENGILVEGRARIFLKDDFRKFDKIYVMDTQNYWDVMDLARSDEDKAKVEYLLNTLEPGLNKVVPNPYSSGIADCMEIYRILDRATDRIAEMATVEEERRAIAHN
jgi:protein-tyrosine phosphatase